MVQLTVTRVMDISIYQVFCLSTLGVPRLDPLEVLVLAGGHRNRELGTCPLFSLRFLERNFSDCITQIVLWLMHLKTKAI